jgi:primosomal protein N' (replication factor Y)
VVDEEHDTSYKQEDGVLYNARDMAVLRAAIVGCPVVLASATPSLKAGPMPRPANTPPRPVRRFGTAELPEMRAIDMRAESPAPNRWISEAGARGEARIGRGEQALLFLNRRGYAPVTLCRACGHQVGCDDCDARMVEHRFQSGWSATNAARPSRCPWPARPAGSRADGGRRPGGGAAGRRGGGALPQARLAVLSSDLFGSARALEESRSRRLPKAGPTSSSARRSWPRGTTFPLLTLVGVIDADLGLQGSDLRAAERTFQLMRQVAGRAGRANARARPGCRPTSPNIR